MDIRHFAILLLGTFGCAEPDTSVKVVNSIPQALITSHADGASMTDGDTVTFSGGHFRLAVGGVLPDAGLLYLQHPGRTAPETGSTVRLTIDPSDLIFLADQTSTHS